jgi:hypothetical protein
MRGLRSGVLAAALCLLLAGCSDGGAGGSSAPAASSPSARSATLADTCPEVEKVIVTLGTDPKAAVLDTAHRQVVVLSTDGDAETKKALAGLVTALAAYRDAHPGQQTLDAKSALAGALTTFTGRCKALGAFPNQ